MASVIQEAGQATGDRLTLNSNGYLVILWIGLNRNELMESSLMPPSSIAAYRTTHTLHTSMEG